MLKNYLKIAFRNLVKHKSHTLINVGGLTLGIVCAIIIFLVVQFDLSFDTWHADADRIYRVVREDSEFGNINYDTGGPYPLASAVESDITGIEYVTLVDNNYGNTPVVLYIENGQIMKRFKEENLALVEPEFFKIFTYQWISGNPETALEQPNSVVVTEDFAKKMFGNLNVLGKEIVLNSGSLTDLTITGLVKDQPENSDFPFTIILASNSKDRDGDTAENESWDGSSSSLQTYVKLLPGVSPEDVNKQFDDLIIKYRDAQRAEVTEFFLQPLSEIHFDSRFGNYNGRVVEKRTLFSIGIIGIFLILTACINFINLNTAVAVRRSKEVGLRKTLGSTKSQLVLHFLGETAFTTLIALLIGIGISELVLRGIEPLLGFTPELNLASNRTLILFLISLFVGITLAAGWYPARYLSGFSPIEAIRNKINASYGQGLILRRSLIIVQFTITQILVIGTIVISAQIKHFQKQELGFQQNAIVQVDIPNRNRQTLKRFKETLLNSSSVISATFSNTGTTYGNVWGGNYVIYDDTLRYENDADIKFIDEDFLDTYGIRLLAGSNITQSDTVNKYLITEALARQIGYGDNYDGLIGKPLIFWGREAPIVGVVNDFNTSSLHEELRPVVLGSRPSYFVGAIKINAQRTSDALASIEAAYLDAFPDFIFEYEFLDDHIKNMYEEEQRTANIMNSFTVIAILIGCLGLFGLVSYMAATRTKEIGVRKVLGATIPDILRIFTGELGLLTGISFLLAAPVAWYMMQKWLEDFAYKIDIGIGIFAMAFTGTLIIAALTIVYKSVTAALANPIDSLKSE